ncbi:MAG: hypothetical protein DBX97_04240 [Collinsella tanakaei]|nr:MAG: hypothetical protein DBX97_04240 [Collinsella tanakaei]
MSSHISHIRTINAISSLHAIKKIFAYITFCICFNIFFLKVLFEIWTFFIRIKVFIVSDFANTYFIFIFSIKFIICIIKFAIITVHMALNPHRRISHLPQSHSSCE